MASKKNGKKRAYHAARTLGGIKLETAVIGTFAIIGVAEVLRGVITGKW